MNSTVADASPNGRPGLVPGPWSRAHQGNHVVLFYEDDEYLLAELARAGGAALDLGGSVVILATEEHRAGLERHLAARGCDVAGAVACGRFVSLDAKEALAQVTTNGRLDAGTFRRRIGGILSAAACASTTEETPLVFGELVIFPLAIDDAAQSIQLEGLWNELLSELDFTLVCAYPLDSFGGRDGSVAMEAVCAAHTSVVPAESYADLPTEADRMREIALLQQKARALANREEEARRALDARDSFLWAAAHDFRTPVTSIRGYAQLLRRATQRGLPLDAKRLGSALATIELQTARLTDLLDRLLDTMGGPSGRLTIERTLMDVAATLRTVLARQPLPVRHHLALTCPEVLPGSVDPIRFEQLVTILLDNAVRYNPAGGEIGVILADDGAAGIRLTVEDEGVGIPADERARIFERHQPASSSEHLAGMGLGLFVARQIVEQHGGTIHVEQPDHAGARFVVQLPAQPPAA